MTQPIFDQTFEQRIARINLDAVMQHVAKDTGLEGEDLTRAEDLYRKYLTLRSRYPEVTMVPPRIVDHVWHAHITFTRQYMADCELLFGEYLHHTPMEEDTDAMYHSGTVMLMARDFGVSLPTYAQIQPSLYAAGPCS